MGFLEYGHWKVGMVTQFGSPQNVSSILATQFNFQTSIPDQPIWKPNTKSDFSCSSAWNVIRMQRTKKKINTYTLNKNIPFKCSFLLCRAFGGKVPTNEKITSFVHDPTVCYRCYTPVMDTIDHIFVTGTFATNVWKFLHIHCKFPTHINPLDNML